MAKYQKTIVCSSYSLSVYPPKVGQWVAIEGGIRGQYLGTTKGGTVVMRYQNGKFGKIDDFSGNHALRMFAKNNGSK